MKIVQWIIINCYDIAEGNVPYFPYLGQITYKI